MEELVGGWLVPFGTNNSHVLGYQRPGLLDGEASVLVLANFAETPQDISAQTLSGLPETALGLIGGQHTLLRPGITLERHGVRWYRL